MVGKTHYIRALLIEIINSMKKLSFLMAAVGLVAMTSCNRTPTATFTTDATSVTVGEVVTFTNTSEDAYNAVWDFGDGTQSMAYSPTHVYETPGTYAATLQIENRRGSEVVVSSATTITVDSVSAEPLPAASVVLTADKSEYDFYEYATFVATPTGGDVLYYVWKIEGSYSNYAITTNSSFRGHRSWDIGTLNVSVTVVFDPEQGIEPVTSSLTVEIDSTSYGNGMYDQNAAQGEMRNNLAGEWNLEDEDFDYDQEVGGYDDYDLDFDRDYLFYGTNRILKTENDPSFSGNRLSSVTWSHIFDNVISADGDGWMVFFDGNEMTWIREQFISYYDFSTGQEYDIRLTVTRTFVRK